MTPQLRIADHDIRTVPDRMKRIDADPLAAVLNDDPDLMAARERLAARVE